ncbi:helix-turn-helix domain-containing protein [Rhodocytophaga rosea]|uniref:Helix-turn-helix domain-containing protein n=1 Tax=Rhodocytophaga rosea TaxID=2704465 RepID=A0A6C0GDJ2_9BACT|nr:helix-turn-helix domain-containing protein [Rhodocytophaga rosea]QHT66031.1 helix-turn-helix domain-containing protein [Rhodocytophaga rosea]
MSRQERYVELDALEKLTLEEGLQNHPKTEFRKHCQMLLFSAKGKTAKEIALLLDSNYQSVLNCFTNWQQKGLVGLMRSRGQGRKATLSQVDEGQLKAIISEYRQSARKATAQLEKELAVKVHPETLRRFLKSVSTLSVACVRASKANKTRLKDKPKKHS